MSLEYGSAEKNYEMDDDFVVVNHSVFKPKASSQMSKVWKEWSKSSYGSPEKLKLWNIKKPW